MGKRIVLLTCLDPDIISGGNIYNKKLAESFKRLKIDFSIVFSKTPSNILNNLTSEEICIVDSIVLNEHIDWKSISHKSIYILLHMCPSRDEANNNKEIKQIEKFVFNNFPIFSVGAASIDYLKTCYNILSPDYTIVQPGIDETWDRKQIDVNTEPSKFIVLSNITNEKGILRAIHTFNFLNKDAILDIYGAFQDSQLVEEIKNVIDSLNLSSKVNLKGACKHSDVNTLLLQYDILLHLSDHENNALAIRESIATGIPFVTTPTGDYKTFLKNEVGIVTSNFKAKDIAVMLNKELYDSLNYKALVVRSRKHIIPSWESITNLFISKMELS